MKIFHLDRENTLSVSFFSDVTNSKELLSSILDGTLKLEVSFLNALLVKFFSFLHFPNIL
ncbi:hypothetical protein F2Q70_00033966 [Brassica cretica]|uniref:Uncharacterized protein n=1 Tax=Brassica cretica TaxID=69181 RepID=A0A8S9JS71_BRACR|nr:hypothetical protein F2Q70_00033966 [Brassica cretica]